MPSSTKQMVNDIYSGIIAPQGGIYKPGPPVMLPPSGYNNQALAKALMDPVGDQSYLNWDQFDDQFGNSSALSVPHANGTLVANKDQSRMPSSPAGNLFAYGEPAANAPGQQAIDVALNGQSKMPTTGLGFTQWGDAASGMNWEPSNPGPAPAGDPWQKMRVGQQPVPQTSGMTTGNRGLGAIGNPAVYSQPTAPAISAYQQALATAAAKAKTTPEVIHQQLMAQQTDKPQQAGEAPGSGFLRAQGQNTSGMSAGQQANALNKSIFGKGFGG